MRLYPTSLSTARRLRHGARLIRGLGRQPETAPLVPPISDANDALEAAYTPRLRLEPVVEERSDDVRFAEMACERDVRRLFRHCQALDGDRVGAVTRVGFPDGLTAVIAAQGESQTKALRTLRTAYAESLHPTVVAHREELLPLVDHAIATFTPAYDTWVAAVQARDAALSLERLRRKEHRRAFSVVFGGLRALFPDDRELQDAIVPDVARAGAGVPDEEDDDPTPVDA